MKIQLHYSLGIGGFDGYRTVTIPKYLENAPNNKLRKWLEDWIRTHIKDFCYSLNDWTMLQ